MVADSSSRPTQLSCSLGSVVWRRDISICRVAAVWQKEQPVQRLGGGHVPGMVREAGSLVQLERRTLGRRR